MSFKLKSFSTPSAFEPNSVRDQENKQFVSTRGAIYSFISSSLTVPAYSWSTINSTFTLTKNYGTNFNNNSNGIKNISEAGWFLVSWNIFIISESNEIILLGVSVDDINPPSNPFDDNSVYTVLTDNSLGNFLNYVSASVIVYLDTNSNVTLKIYSASGTGTLNITSCKLNIVRI